MEKQFLCSYDPKNVHNDLCRAASGLEDADIIFKNGEVFNVFTLEWERQDFAVKDGIILGYGGYSAKEEIDLKGAKVIPGLIDTHVHIESSLLRPAEYGRLVLKHGVTTIIADPHEIANVCGRAGMDYMLNDSKKTPADILFAVPSCVPATPADVGGAVLSSKDIRDIAESPEYAGKIASLGEVMNYPGVINGDEEVLAKLSLFRTIDGHAPMLSGKDLNAYILQGITSDHECTSAEEALEKLKKGMCIQIRQAAGENNLEKIIRIVNPFTLPFCMYATDDCHIGSLVSNGSVENCIRLSIKYGLKPEYAYRIASLSAAMHYGLSDRGSLSPGKLADFCVIEESPEFHVTSVYKRGICVSNLLPSAPSEVVKSKYDMKEITPDDIKLTKKGRAHVISLIEGQIVTDDLITEVDSAALPDLKRDIVKCVVASRYGRKNFGAGLIKGLNLKRGAAAASVSHDAHNAVAAGCSDEEIIKVLNLLNDAGGGYAAVVDGKEYVFPLPCGGLMTYDSYEKAASEYADFCEVLRSMGAGEEILPHLSFAALTVIPKLRLTERGVFDAVNFRDIELFES